MKKTRSITLLTVMMLVPATRSVGAQSIFELAGAEPKYTPGDFRPAPETMHTRFGTLEFPGGYPTEGTSRKVFDELDLQRATQLYLDMYPALSAHGLMKGWIRDLGMCDSSHISVTANRLDSSALVLTGNTESLYPFAVFDLKKDGPTVFEVPPGVMGPLDDHNFLFVTDIGPTGMDRARVVSTFSCRRTMKAMCPTVTSSCGHRPTQTSPSSGPTPRWWDSAKRRSSITARRRRSTR